MMTAKQLRPGTVVVWNGALCRAMVVTHIAPGNWRAMVQVKWRNLNSGNQEEHRFGSDETLERAILEQHDMEFLYEEGGQYNFMNSETYEQILLNLDELGNAPSFLIPNSKVTIEFHDGRAIGVALPTTVALKIIEAEPSMKHATAAASYKQAKVETGLAVKVPNFIDVGDTIKVNTETCEYVERA